MWRSYLCPGPPIMGWPVSVHRPTASRSSSNLSNYLVFLGRDRRFVSFQDGVAAHAPLHDAAKEHHPAEGGNLGAGLAGEYAQQLWLGDRDAQHSHNHQDRDAENAVEHDGVGARPENRDSDAKDHSQSAKERPDAAEIPRQTVPDLRPVILD